MFSFLVCSAAGLQSPVVTLNVGESPSLQEDPCKFSHGLLTDLLKALKSK